MQKLLPTFNGQNNKVFQTILTIWKNFNKREYGKT